MKAYTYNDRLVGVGNDQILGTDQGGGSKEYYAGQYISIDENDVISVTGLAPVSAIPDVSDMATQTWVGQQGYLTEVPSTYATDIEVYNATVTAIDTATAVIPDTEDVTFEEVNLSNYALASAIPTFTEGNCIDITSNAISWETTAGITDIISVTALPANPVATVIYLIPET